MDGFDLVTVDIDEHPMLAQSCKVVSVPTVKSCVDGVLKDGKVMQNKIITNCTKKNKVSLVFPPSPA